MGFCLGDRELWCFLAAGLRGGMFFERRGLRYFVLCFPKIPCPRVDSMIVGKESRDSIISATQGN